MSKRQRERLSRRKKLPKSLKCWHAQLNPSKKSNSKRILIKIRGTNKDKKKMISKLKKKYNRKSIYTYRVQCA